MDTNNNNTTAPVKVEQILSTRNAEIFQLMLRQEVQKPAEANPLGFFLEGYPGVGDGIEKRVAFQTVSKQFIEKYNITEDCDFAIAIGKPSSGDVLTKNGQPIYRNCEVTFDLEKPDTLIAHDRASTKTATAVAAQMVDDIQG